jgi:hypothetical protein
MGKEAKTSDQSGQSTDGSSRWNGFSIAELHAQIEKVLASREFFQSVRMGRFLRFSVEKTLRGEEDELKEYLLGIAVFDRNGEYDPHIDPIVRVEARRLRAKLNRYYESEGRHDPILIEYPKGHYVPLFTKKVGFTTVEINEPPQIVKPIDEAQEPIERRKKRSSARVLKRTWTFGLAGVLVALITGSLALWRVWQ